MTAQSGQWGESHKWELGRSLCAVSQEHEEESLTQSSSPEGPACAQRSHHLRVIPVRVRCCPLPAFFLPKHFSNDLLGVNEYIRCFSRVGWGAESFGFFFCSGVGDLKSRHFHGGTAPVLERDPGEVSI